MNINNTSIKTRVLTLVLIPVLVTIGFAVEKLISAGSEMKRVQQLGVLQEYIYTIAPVVSALQQEILYSKISLGLSSKDTVAIEQIKSKISASRRVVDPALEAYRHFITNRSELNQFSSMTKQINFIDNKLQDLELLRGLINKRQSKIKNTDPNKTGKYIWSILFLQKIVEAYIESTNEVVLLASSNKELSLLAHVYQNLLYAQNASTTQFSTVYRGITAKLTGNSFGGIVKQAAMEEAFLKKAEAFATPAGKSSIGSGLRKNESQQYVTNFYEQIRRKYKTVLDTQLDLDKNDWLQQGVLVSEAYQNVINNVLNEIDQTKSVLESDAKTKMISTATVLIILLIALALISTWIIRSINNPLKGLVQSLDKLSESKDLRLRNEVDGNNELSSVAHAFNHLIESFEDTLASVREQIVSIEQQAHNASGSMNESMESINEQKVATDSISVAVNQMTTTIYEVAQMASTASDAVNTVHGLAQSSENDAKVTKSTIDQLVVELGDTSELVAHLNDEAAQISNVLSVIKGISEQTNLLALNAAIEAARAGEMGRGFAVVADEVRSLSKRTQESTEQIESQIDSLINGAKTASSKMITLQESGSSAVDIVDKSTAAFVAIKSEMDNLSDMASQIAVAAEEQTNVADEINQRIHTIKDGSDVMFDQGQNTSASVKHLSDDTEVLKKNIEVFHFN